MLHQGRNVVLNSSHPRNIYNIRNVKGHRLSSLINSRIRNLKKTCCRTPSRRRIKVAQWETPRDDPRRVQTRSELTGAYNGFLAATTRNPHLTGKHTRHAAGGRESAPGRPHTLILVAANPPCKMENNSHSEREQWHNTTLNSRSEREQWHNTT